MSGKIVKEMLQSKNWYITPMFCFSDSSMYLLNFIQVLYFKRKSYSVVFFLKLDII